MGKSAGDQRKRPWTFSSPQRIEKFSTRSARTGRIIDVKVRGHRDVLES